MAFDVHFLRGAGALCGAENGLASPDGDEVNCATCAELLRPTAQADAFPAADAPHPKIAARYYPRPPAPVSLTRRRWA
jgi:hypothetical protein